MRDVSLLPGQMGHLGGASTYGGVSPNLQPPTYLEVLKQQREQLQDYLNRIDAAIHALESNPAVAIVLDSVRKVGL